LPNNINEILQRVDHLLINNASLFTTLVFLLFHLEMWLQVPFFPEHSRKEMLRDLKEAPWLMPVDGFPRKCM
jgi:hypothetical protein